MFFLSFLRNLYKADNNNKKTNCENSEKKVYHDGEKLRNEATEPWYYYNDISRRYIYIFNKRFKRSVSAGTSKVPYNRNFRQCHNKNQNSECLRH